jgi:glycosyltransferase involved in cell wall biosynthesis
MNGQRLALFLPNFAGGGAERVMVNLAKGFAKRGLRVDLLLAEAAGPYLNEVPTSIRVIDLKAKRVSGSLLPLTRYLRREKPTALLSALRPANVVAVLAKKLSRSPTRIVITEHSSRVWRKTPARTRCQGAGRTTPPRIGEAFNARRALLRVLARQSYPMADSVIAVSTGVAEDIAASVRLRANRLHVAPNAVVTDETQRMARATLSHPWFLPGASPVILAVGRLAEEKDFPTLIRAFVTVRRTTHARLLILGEGEERPRLEALVRSLELDGSVQLPGFVRNPFAFMARSAVFVLSSAREAMPTVLIEALACGLPVVATDCGSGPRELLRDGLYGRLVPMGHADGLAKAIVSTLQGPRQAIPREAWAPFLVRNAVDRYLEILLDRPS